MREWKFGRGRGGVNKVAYRHVCEWCGAGFPSKRPDACTCSNACRLKWTRWVRKWVAKYGTKPSQGPRGDKQREYLHEDNSTRPGATRRD